MIARSLRPNAHGRGRPGRQDSELGPGPLSGRRKVRSGLRLYSAELAAEVYRLHIWTMRAKRKKVRELLVTERKCPIEQRARLCERAPQSDGAMEINLGLLDSEPTRMVLRLV
jgi:hypothetical protein